MMIILYLSYFKIKRFRRIDNNKIRFIYLNTYFDIKRKRFFLNLYQTEGELLTFLNNKYVNFFKKYRGFK